MTEKAVINSGTETLIINRLKANCPHGLLYFCDGSVNRTQMKKGPLERKEPCKWLKDGKCTNEACKL